MNSDSNETTPKPRDPRAFNAYRHGLTGHVLVIEPADELAYKQHCRGIHQSLAPFGALETDLVQSIADDRWRLKRAAAIESNILAGGLQNATEVLSENPEIDTALQTARTWLNAAKEIERIALYESRLQRRVEKNLALIRQLQLDRHAAIDLLARQSEDLDEAYDFPPEASPFVFSNDQIRRLAHHQRSLRDARRSPRRAA